MEVSSHALVLGRVDGAVFDVAVFTNLSPEHMEFHSDMEDYFQAKAQLFTPRRSRLGVVNVDDEYGRRLSAEAERAGRDLLRRGRAGRRLARRGRRRSGPMDSRLHRDRPQGRAGAGRRAAARAVQRRQHAAPRSPRWPPPARRRRPPPTASPPSRACPGRLERVDAGPAVPRGRRLRPQDRRRRVGAARAAHGTTEGRLHVVLGCGGDRDPTKRGADGRRRSPGSPTPRCSPSTTRAPRTRWRSSPRCWPAPLSVPAERARTRSSSNPTGPPRVGRRRRAARGPATSCWWPARAMSRARTSPARCAPSTTERCCARAIERGTGKGRQP